MGVVGIGMKKADGHRRDIFAPQFLCDCRQLGLVKRHQHLAIRRQSLPDRKAELARHEGRRPVDHQIIVIEALLVTLLENVAETFRGDEGGLGPLPLDQRVGGKGGAMNENVDVARPDPRLSEDYLNPLDHAKFRRMGGGEHLAAPALGSRFENDVGECAADIGGKLDLLRHGGTMAGLHGFASFLSSCVDADLAPQRATMAKVTIQDVARTAGVSVATVDRVLNRRPGVRGPTVGKVESAIRELNYQPDRIAARLARSREYRFCFVLPARSGDFWQRIDEEVRLMADRMVGERVSIQAKQVDVFDGLALANCLDSIGDIFDGVAVVALDHPAVREAINALQARGVTVVTLVSDVPGSKRSHYAGIDNSSAGRTAANLMGRFLRGLTGKVGLIAGSLALRDHIERQFGFEQVMAHEYPNLAVLPVRESRDDWKKLEEMTAQLLVEHPDVIGLYNVGGGTRGIVSGLETAGRGRDVVFIAHELTDPSRRALIRGTIDAIINQDPGHEVRSAVRVLMAKADNLPLIESQERIRIDIFLRDNLP
jgi:LacI family transcriptional regulator